MAQVYHIRTINGQTAPIPKSLRVVEYTLDKDSYRSASGLLKRNVLGFKMKFYLVFSKGMSKTDLQSLLTLLNLPSFVVEYEDIYDGTIKSGNFYCGSKKIKPLWIKDENNTDILFDDFSINLIEY